MNKVIILAAGKGTRMNSDLPKVLVPVNGRPMIEYLLESVASSKVDARPIIVASPQNVDLFKSVLSKFVVEYVVQECQLGTGHAVACAIKDLEEPIDKILVFNGDHPFVKPESIKKLGMASSKVNMLTVSLDDFADWRNVFYHWGRLVRVGDDIVAIIEFKDSDDSIKKITEVNPAMYAFDFKWLKDNINKINDDNAQKEYYLTDSIGLAFRQSIKIETLSIDPAEAIGINSKEELEVAEKILNGEVR